MSGSLQAVLDAAPTFGKIECAARVQPGRMPQPTSLAARQGLRFQRRVERALNGCASKIGGHFEPEPWFHFQRERFDTGHAVPDGVFTFGDFQLVIEVKLTYVPSAIPKLLQLYVPVVEKAYRLRVRPLLICKHLNSAAADHVRVETLAEALKADGGSVPLLHYPGDGGILWSHAPPVNTWPWPRP